MKLLKNHEIIEFFKIVQLVITLIKFQYFVNESVRKQQNCKIFKIVKISQTLKKRRKFKFSEKVKMVTFCEN